MLGKDEETTAGTGDTRRPLLEACTGEGAVATGVVIGESAEIGAGDARIL